MRDGERYDSMPGNAALLVIDVQNGWRRLSDGLSRSLDRHRDAITDAVSLFHRKGSLVIFTYQVFEKEGIVPGTSEFDLIPEIAIGASDICVVKRKMNAFNGTGLREIILDAGYDSVIIAGLSALHCVMSSYYAAYDQDIRPLLLGGAVAGPDEESVRLAESICSGIRLEDIR